MTLSIKNYFKTNHKYLLGLTGYIIVVFFLGLAISFLFQFIHASFQKYNVLFAINDYYIFKLFFASFLITLIALGGLAMAEGNKEYLSQKPQYIKEKHETLTLIVVLLVGIILPIAMQ